MLRFENWLVLGVVSVLCAGSAAAGSIRGTVVFEGKAPGMRSISVEADPLCVAKHADNPAMTDWLVLGEGQTLANVLVQVVAGAPEKIHTPPTEPRIIQQVGCMYTPHVVAVQVGQPLMFVNSDEILHNVHLWPVKNQEFNKSMTAQRKEMVHVFKKPEPMFTIKCDVHVWMLAYCAVLDHPYFMVTGADGVYAIDGLEPGAYTLEIWHERLGTQTAAVTVPETGDATQDFTLSRKKQ